MKVIPIVADNGAMGGKKSEEFMIISEQGEDKILYDDKIGIGINTEVLEKENYKEYLKEEYGISASNIIDAGASLYKSNQNKLSGASGPVVLPLYLFNKVLLSKKNKKILIVGTGALHNPTLVNQKKSIPAIAHVVELEVI